MKNFLKQHRQIKKVSQQELAKLCNVHRITFSKWESGEASIPADKLFLVTKRLDIHPYQVYNLEDEATEKTKYEIQILENELTKLKKSNELLQKNSKKELKRLMIQLSKKEMLIDKYGILKNTINEVRKISNFSRLSDSDKQELIHRACHRITLEEFLRP
jgi:transcriptional regulator with XRE-family HTH domain